MIGTARACILTQDDACPIDCSPFDPAGLGQCQAVLDGTYGGALASKECRNDRGRERNDQQRCHDCSAALTVRNSAQPHQSRTE